MKIYLIIAIVLFQTAILTAQTTNKGKVKGVVTFKSTNIPVEYATIALFDTDKKQVINSRYVSSQLTPQGQRDAGFITNLGARYELRKYNLSCLATVSDLFNTFQSYTISVLFSDMLPIPYIVTNSLCVFKEYKTMHYKPRL